MAFTQDYASSINYTTLGNPNFQSGDREDLTDVISMIAPETLPVLNLAAKSKAQATYHEWQMDDLLPVITVGIPEAQDFSAFTNEAAPRVRTGNFVQRIGDAFGVSVEQSLVNVAGVENEYDRARIKKTKEILRSLEAALCSTNDMQAGGSQGAQMRGLGTWIQNAAQTNNAVPANYRTPTGNIKTGASSSFLESDFKTIIQNVYYQTGDISLGYDFVVGPALKNVIANFVKATVISTTTLDTRRQNYNGDDNNKELKDGIDVYDSDFGRVRIMPTMFNALTNGANPKTTTTAQLYQGYLLRRDLIEVAYLREIGAQELPDLGGGRRGYVDVLATLVVKNPLGLGKVTS